MEARLEFASLDPNAALGDGSNGGGRGEFDPDNSDTWSDAEKERRRADALAMSLDDYLKLIPKSDSIFRIVHVRYQKVQKRWLPPSQAAQKALAKK